MVNHRSPKPELGVRFPPRLLINKTLPVGSVLLISLHLLKSNGLKQSESLHSVLNLAAKKKTRRNTRRRGSEASEPTALLA